MCSPESATSKVSSGLITQVRSGLVRTDTNQQPWSHSTQSLSFLQCGNCDTKGPGGEEAEDSSRATQWISDNVYHPGPVPSSLSVVTGNHSHTVATIPVSLWLGPGHPWG